MIQQPQLPQELLQLLQQLQELIRQQQLIRLQINQLPEIMGPEGINQLPQPLEYIDQQRQSRQQLIQQLRDLAGVLENQQQQLQRLDFDLDLDIEVNELGLQKHQQIQQIEEQQKIVKQSLYQQIHELDQGLLMLQIFELMLPKTKEERQNIVQILDEDARNNHRPQSPKGSQY